LLPRAVLPPRAAAAPAVQQSIDISNPRRMLLQRANGTDRRTDTVPFRRPCWTWCERYADERLMAMRVCVPAAVRVVPGADGDC